MITDKDFQELARLFKEELKKDKRFSEISFSVQGNVICSLRRAVMRFNLIKQGYVQGYVHVVEGMVLSSDDEIPGRTQTFKAIIKALRDQGKSIKCMACLLQVTENTIKKLLE